MDVCDIDAEAMLEQRRGKVLDESAIRSFAFQLFSGLDAIHNYGIVHRDVKASNILLKADGTLKVADMGMCRPHTRAAPAHGHDADGGHRDGTQNGDDNGGGGGGGGALDEVLVPDAASGDAGGEMSPCVGSRWYRSPELLYSSRNYGYETDVWSAGLVIGDVLIGEAGRLIGRGDTDIEQIRRVHAVLGSPCVAPENETALVRAASDYGKIAFKSCNGCGVVHRLKQCGVPPGVAERSGVPLGRMLRYGNRGECHEYIAVASDAAAANWMSDNGARRAALAKAVTSDAAAAHRKHRVAPPVPHAV